MVGGGGGGWVVLKPTLVLSLSQAEQLIIVWMKTILFGFNGSPSLGCCIQICAISELVIIILEKQVLAI